MSYLFLETASGLHSVHACAGNVEEFVCPQTTVAILKVGYGNQGTATWTKECSKQLSESSIYWCYCGGLCSDDNFLFNKGITDIREGVGTIYTPPYWPPDTHYYGPYLKGNVGTYQVDYKGSNINCVTSYMAYCNTPHVFFNVVDYTSSNNHLEALINVTIDCTSLTGIEFIAVNGNKVVKVNTASMTRVDDIIIKTNSYQGRGLALITWPL